MTDAGNFDAAPIDPAHGSSGPGGPLPGPEIQRAPVESEQPETRHGAADIGTAGSDIEQPAIASGTESGSYEQPEVRTACSDFEHPAWCDTATCGVRIDAGTAFGAHRSKRVTLPGRIEVRLSIWALHGTPAAIAFDIIDETAAEGLRDVEVPAFVAEVPLTLGELLRESGVLLDVEEARTAGRVLLELARRAEEAS